MELLLTSLLVVGYFLVRGAHPDNIPASMDRLLALVRFEQRWGLFEEVHVQQAAIDAGLIDFANFVYVWSMYPAMAAGGIWLAFTNLPLFIKVRNVLLVSAVIGIIGYWMLPTAPPRLLAEYGFLDTVHGSNPELQPKPFLNEYAAIPSFHFAWVALTSAGIWLNTRSWLVRAGAVALSLLVLWSVIATGNHLFIDVILGGIVVVGSWAVVGAWPRMRPSIGVSG